MNQLIPNDLTSISLVKAVNNQKTLHALSRMRLCVLLSERHLKKVIRYNSRREKYDWRGFESREQLSGAASKHLELYHQFEMRYNQYKSKL